MDSDGMDQAGEAHGVDAVDSADLHRTDAFLAQFNQWLRLAGLERLKLAVHIAEGADFNPGTDDSTGDPVGEAVRWLCDGRGDGVPPLVLEYIVSHTQTVDDEARCHARRASRLASAAADVMSSAVATRERRHAGRLRPPQASNLTDREYEVLVLIGAAQKNRQIAAALRISEKTVKNHITSLFAKLGVFDRTEAVVTGVRDGLLTIPAGGRVADGSAVPSHSA